MVGSLDSRIVGDRVRGCLLGVFGSFLGRGVLPPCPATLQRTSNTGYSGFLPSCRSVYETALTLVGVVVVAVPVPVAPPFMGGFAPGQAETHLRTLLSQTK